MTNSIVELILVVILLAIASFYGKQGALLPLIWWLVGIVIIGLRINDIVTKKRK